MKKLNLLFLSVVAAFSVSAQAPEGYYSALEGKCKGDLKKAAKSIVYSHTEISYGESGTWVAFKETDVRYVNGKAIWWDMYSNNEVAVSSGHGGLNIEHSVANSWWGKTKNAAYKDLFHLNPSNSDANSRKSNFPLGEVADVTWTNGITTVGTPKSGLGGGNSKVYEPADCYKGDFARVFFYMFTVYDNLSWKSNTDWMYSTSSELTLKPWAYEMLLRWAKEDPVDQKEIDRNNAIYKIQGNRNPFIDLPDLCEYIWGDKNTIPYHVEGNPGNPGNPDNPDNPEEPEEELLYADFERNAISDYVAQGWGNDALSGTLDGWFIKEFQGNRYASASSFKETGNGPFEYWLVTPALDIDGGVATLTFRTQGAYGCDGSKLEVFLLDSDDPSSAVREQLPATICTPQPEGAKPVYSDWVGSGNVVLESDLKTAYVGFCYTSATGGASGSATYCLDDVKVTFRRKMAVGNIEAPDLDVVPGHGCVSVSVAEGDTARVFDMSGRLVAVTSGGDVELPAGIYIVVSGISRAKVAVR